MHCSTSNIHPLRCGSGCISKVMSRPSIDTTLERAAQVTGRVCGGVGVGLGGGGGVDWGRVGGRVALLGEISFGVCGLCSWALVGALDLFVHKCLQLT